MHPRVSLQQVPFLNRSAAEFLAFCSRIGVRNAVLAQSLAEADALRPVQAAVASHGVRIAALTHVFCRDLSQAGKEATEALLAAIRSAGALGVPAIYMITGGRGRLDWDDAAARFAALVAPCHQAARENGVRLLIENILPLYADIHIAHGLADAAELANRAGIGLCIELFHCWAEADIEGRLRGAASMAGLVQVSDYVPGDRALPARAVPGDGAIPLERLVRALLDGGYQGVFDLELVGPRIEAEGIETAARRAAEYLSAMLDRLGA